jgi:two-component system, response regulator / RNA-binding antiterminator
MFQLSRAVKRPIAMFFSRMTRELEEARSELENRKLIDRAKGILMSTRGLGGARRPAAVIRLSAISEILRLVSTGS